MGNSTSQWHPKTQMLTSSSLGSRLTQEIHGKKSIFSMFLPMEKQSKTCFKPQSCKVMIS